MNIEQIQTTLTFLTNTPVVITFSNHEIDTQILSVEKQTLATIKGLAPDKRMRDGKMRTPEMFAIITEDGRLTFVNEDTEIIQRTNGVVLRVGNTDVCINKTTME
jgi:hypothetical protein